MSGSKINKNIYVNFSANVLLMIVGIIVPKIFITSYGSDTNGLISTLTQIFSYMALMEAGIGQAAKNAMYKPLADRDYDRVSYVTSIASRYYRRIALYYGIGVVALSVICPFVLKTGIDHFTVFWIIILEGASKVITFYFNSTYTYFLAANGRSYINNEVNVIVSLITYVAKICLAMLGYNILFLQVTHLCLGIGMVIFYKKYFKKHYAWVDLNLAPKDEKLKDRNSYVVESLSWLAFSSTDMIVLSTFISTTLSSVYSVYTMIFNCLNTLINSVYTGVNYFLSQSFHEDLERYKCLHDGYTSIFLGGMTILLCTAYILILPFMSLYMGKVTDAQYVNPSLPFMFCLIQLFSWSRYVTGNLAGVAGYQKEQGRVSVIEAFINIVLSIALVHKFGIVGVLFASVIALPIKVIYITWLCECRILKRNPVKFLCILGVNYIYFILTVFANRFIDFTISNWLSFFIHGIIVFIICAVIGIAINCFVNPYCIKMINQLIKRR